MVVAGTEWGWVALSGVGRVVGELCGGGLGGGFGMAGMVLG